MCLVRQLMHSFLHFQNDRYLLLSNYTVTCFCQGFDRLHVILWYQWCFCNLSHSFQVEGATGDYHTNLSAKKDALVQHLTPVDSKYTFGFLHVKAVDDAGHDKNRELKVLSRLFCIIVEIHTMLQVEFLNRIDTMIGELMIVRMCSFCIFGFVLFFSGAFCKRTGNGYSVICDVKFLIIFSFSFKCCRYSIAVTGDHCTPVALGDHSFRYTIIYLWNFTSL